MRWDDFEWFDNVHVRFIRTTSNLVQIAQCTQRASTNLATVERWKERKTTKSIFIVDLITSHARHMPQTVLTIDKNSLCAGSCHVRRSIHSSILRVSTTHHPFNPTTFPFASLKLQIKFIYYFWSHFLFVCLFISNRKMIIPSLWAFVGTHLSVIYYLLLLKFLPMATWHTIVHLFNRNWLPCNSLLSAFLVT